MTDEKNKENGVGYKGLLIKAMNTRDNYSFYGRLKDRDQEFIHLFPYLAYEPSENGQHYACWITEGKPFEIKNDSISAIHQVTQEQVNLIISNYKKNADMASKKLRLEEIANEMELIEKEKAYKKLKSEI